MALTLPNISYTGRWSFASAAPTFSWASTQFSVRTTATELSGKFTSPDGGMRLGVLVNGSEHAVHRVKAGERTVRLASNLTGTSTVSVWKLTEDIAQHGGTGVATLHGLLADGALSAPPRPSRRLEFVGDSDTAGYCVDGTDGGSSEETATEDSRQTWAAQLSARLGAEMTAEAISGYGVTSVSTPIQPNVVRTHPFLAGERWDFRSWTPHGIIFLIGPNDVSSADDDGGGGRFVDGYLQLLEVYVHAYAHLAVKPKTIHVCGGSGNGLDACTKTRKALAKFNADHAGDGWVANYTTITDEHWEKINKKGGGFLGCDEHYNRKGHRVLMEDVVDDVRRFLGWEK